MARRVQELRTEEVALYSETVCLCRYRVRIPSGLCTAMRVINYVLLERLFMRLLLPCSTVLVLLCSIDLLLRCSILELATGCHDGPSANATRRKRTRLLFALWRCPD